MAHMEEGTKRNLHSGHMVYMTALMEVGVGTDLCGSSVSSCPRVQLGFHGALALNPQGASTQGLPEGA